MKKEHLEILLEEMNGKFDLVLEGHQTLHHEIVETRTELKKDIEFLNFKIDIVNENLTKRINDVESSLTKRIDDVLLHIRWRRGFIDRRHCLVSLGFGQRL